MRVIIETTWRATWNSYGSDERAIFIGHVKVAGYLHYFGHKFVCRGYQIRKALKHVATEKEARDLCEDICREYIDKLQGK